MSYRPRRTTTPLPDADPSPTTSDDLTAALDSAETVLTTWDGLREVLSETHDQIPRLLAARLAAQSELGGSRIDGRGVEATRAKLARIEEQRVEMSATRISCLSKMVSQQDALQLAKTEIEAAKTAFVAEQVAQFTARYQASIRALEVLWQEAAQLGGALGCTIPTPVPVRIVTPDWQLTEVSPTLQPIVPAVPLSTDFVLDPMVTRIGVTLDRLGASLNFISGALKAEQLRVPLSGGRGIDPAGTYVVLKAFTCQTDSLPFTPGMLIDSTLVPLSTLQRALASKTVRRETGSRAAA